MTSQGPYSVRTALSGDLKAIYRLERLFPEPLRAEPTVINQRFRAYPSGLFVVTYRADEIIGYLSTGPCPNDALQPLYESQNFPLDKLILPANMISDPETLQRAGMPYLLISVIVEKGHTTSALRTKPDMIGILPPAYLLLRQAIEHAYSQGFGQMVGIAETKNSQRWLGRVNFIKKKSFESPELLLRIGEPEIQILTYNIGSEYAELLERIESTRIRS